MAINGNNTNDKIILVDCFNTIIGRKATPNDVLFCWGKQMNEKFSNFSASEFFKIFKRTWYNLKRIDIIEKENSEFLLNINDIFSNIFHQLSKYNYLENISEENFCKIALDIYFNAEKDCHFLKKRTIKFLYKKRKQGYKIYMVSDFYCSAEIIKLWLDNLGVNYEYLFDDIFISCDLNASKNTGSIYRKILETYNFNKKNITMVGDNVYADTIMAKKFGIKTKMIFPPIHFDCKQLRKIKEKTIIPKEYQDIFNENLSETVFSNYAFPFFLFTKRLAESCIRKNIHNLFFLARDGRFLKELFDYYCEENNINVKTHYFHVSRKSVISTSCKDFDTSLKRLAQKSFLSCNNFLRTLNFTKDEIENILKDAKIKKDYYHFNFSKSKHYKAIIGCDKFNDIYTKKRQEQRKNYSKYLNSFNVDFNTEGFNVVDSGWLGNMQLYLKNYFDENTKVQGFYLGNVNKNSVKENMYGLLFASKLRGCNYQDKIFAYRRLNYEEFLRTENGSCKSYDGQGNPIWEDAPNEKIAYYNLIKPMQDKIFEKFKKINETYNKVYCDIDALCADMSYQIFKNLKKQDKKLFIDMQQSVFDGFAYFGISYASVPRPLRNFNFTLRDKIYLLTKRYSINRKKLF